MDQYPENPLMTAPGSVVRTKLAASYSLSMVQPQDPGPVIDVCKDGGSLQYISNPYAVVEI
jgi:hypothetical protein